MARAAHGSAPARDGWAGPAVEPVEILVAAGRHTAKVPVARATRDQQPSPPAWHGRAGAGSRGHTGGSLLARIFPNGRPKGLQVSSSTDGGRASRPHVFAHPSAAQRAGQVAAGPGLPRDDPGAAGVGPDRGGQPAGRPDRAADLGRRCGSCVVAGARSPWSGAAAAIAVLTYGPTLRVIQVVLIALGVGWGSAADRRLADLPAARARPPAPARLRAAQPGPGAGGRRRAWSPRPSIVSAQRELMGPCSPAAGDKVAKQGRYNILLMGGDAGKDRTGLRPDSMTVASVDAETGRTVLISLPRNLEDVPFPRPRRCTRSSPRATAARTTPAC